MTQKEPFLTGFSKHLCGKAKRSAQAVISDFRKRSARRSISSYGRFFAAVLPAEFLASIDTTKRQRHFDQVTVFWAWISQILGANASCSVAVSLIQTWCVKVGREVPDSNTSSYCQARQRIPVPFLDAILARIDARLATAVRPVDLWHGFTLKAIDGTSVQLCDTPENQLEFAQSSGQKDGCGFPVMGLCGLLNLSHGGWEGFVHGNMRTHDAKAAQGLLALIGENDLLMADRAFCSYEIISRVLANGGEVVMRLHQARHRKLDWRRGRKVSPIERLVDWEKPAVQPAASDLTPEQWAQLPEILTLRYIKLGYEDRSGEKRAIVVVTTLLDPVKHDAVEVATLYARRWEIETRFRDVKTTLGMEFMAVKNPAMAVKTLKMMQISYNLIRTIMQRAAIHAGKPLYEISFKGVLDQIVTGQLLFAGPWNHQKLHQQRYETVVILCSEKLVDIRPFRLEPRAMKRRPKPFQLLTAPRRVFKEIPHKSTYRKAA